MKKKISTSIKEFFKELSAAFILVAIFLLLCIVGVVVLGFLPDKIWNDLPTEIIILVGFFACLAVLYLISKIVDTVKKLKQKNIDENKQVNK